MIEGLGISAGLLLTAVIVKSCPMSPRPVVMGLVTLPRVIICGTVAGVLISLIARGFMIGSVGCWLTGVTLTMKLRESRAKPPLAVPPSFIQRGPMMALAVPLVKGFGVNESTPVAFGLV